MGRYAISDLHGCLHLFREVKEMLSDGDVLYVLGDCGDRGLDSWRTIEAVLNDPQCVYMMGNHEDMLINVMRKWYEVFGDTEQEPSVIESFLLEDEDGYLLFRNGGGITFLDWAALDVDSRRYYYNALQLRPLYINFVNDNGILIHLSHAGFTPPMNESRDDLLWNREHFFDEWDESDNSVVVHGHTIIPHLVNYLEMNLCSYIDGGHIIFYANEHKIGIDCASAFTNQICLLNLDTFESMLIQGDDNE